MFGTFRAGNRVISLLIPSTFFAVKAVYRR